MFDYSLGASRVNSVTPYGTQTWTRSGGGQAPAYQPTAQTPGTPQPAASPPSAPQQLVWDSEIGAMIPAAGSGAPTRDPRLTQQPSSSMGGDYYNSPEWQPETWTLNQTLSPEQQQLYDADMASRLQQSSLLGALGQRVQSTLGSPVDTGNLPALSGGPTAQRGEVYRQSVGPLGSPSPGALQSRLAGELAGYSNRIGGLDPLAINQQGADAAYRTGTRYLDPQYETQQRQLESRLAEQGFVPGTPAFQQEMDRFAQGRERAYADARDRATLTGADIGNRAFGNQLGGLQAQIAAALSGANFGLQSQGQEFGQAATQQQMNRQGALDSNQVAQQLFDNDLRGSTFGNQSRQQGLSELLALRALPFNELASIRTGNQVQVPSGQAQYSVPNLNAPNALGAAEQDYQNQLGVYNAGVAGDNALMGGLFGLGAAAMGAPWMGPLLGLAGGAKK